MKKMLLLLTSLLILSSCGINEEDTGSSSSESSSSSIELTDEEKMNKLGELLKSYEGNIRQKKTSQKRVTKYASDGNFEMEVYDDFVTTKYTRGSTYLVESVGTQSINDGDPYETKTQIYNEGLNFLKVVYYGGDEPSTTYTTQLFKKNQVETVYNIGFALEEITNFNYMLEKASDSLLIEYAFENLDGVIVDNKLIYSYSLQTYQYSEGQKVLSEEISFNNSFTIENGLITKLEETYVNTVYVDRLSQSLTATLTTEYIQGEYTEFAGELLKIPED